MHALAGLGNQHGNMVALCHETNDNNGVQKLAPGNTGLW